jgi:hypothetical protein
MPKETLSSRDLVADARTGRYLQELSNHVEDSGDPSVLGNPSELAETFNKYARPKRNAKIGLTGATALITFALPSMLYADSFMRHLYSVVPAPLMQIFQLTGVAIMWPVQIYIYQPTLSFMQIFVLNDFVAKSGYGLFAAQTFNFVENQITTSTPLFASLFWTTIAAVLIFSPYEIFQRNTKRRA